MNYKAKPFSEVFIGDLIRNSGTITKENEMSESNGKIEESDIKTVNWVLRKIADHMNTYSTYYDFPVLNAYNFTEELFDNPEELELFSDAYYVDNYGEDSTQRDEFYIRVEDINDPSRIDDIIKQNKKRKLALKAKEAELDKQAKINEAIKILKEQGLL